MFTSFRLPILIKKIPFTGLSKELTGVLLIKFALLGLLWWLFFAGHKTFIDDNKVASHFFSPASASEESL